MRDRAAGAKNPRGRASLRPGAGDSAYHGLEIERANFCEGGGIFSRVVVLNKGASVAAAADQKVDYLKEHLPYMLKMLRYTFSRMQDEPNYLSWNAHFESFAIHARNLVNFLTNADKNNLKAGEFVKG